MKILSLGQLSHGQTSYMRHSALQRLGHEVVGVDTGAPWTRGSWLGRRVQRGLQYGPIIAEINRTVLSAARDFRPELVWADKQEFLRPETVRTLRQSGARLVHFTPDPYFTLDWKRTRLMDDALGEFDALVYCKSYERKQYEATGKPVYYMPLGYCDEVHRPLPSEDRRWRSRVGFLGGWEPRRERMLHKVAREHETKIWGMYWDFLVDGRWTFRRHLILKQLARADSFRFHADPVLARAYQGPEVYGDDYAAALTGSAIGLGLLRTCCPDQHTTRTFEIPACASMLLADRTAEHRELFEEGREAEFFSSDEELLDKARFYLADEPARSRIASAGRERCISGRYAYIDRLRGAMAWLESM